MFDADGNGNIGPAELHRLASAKRSMTVRESHSAMRICDCVKKLATSAFITDSAPAENRVDERAHLQDSGESEWTEAKNKKLMAKIDPLGEGIDIEKFTT